MKRIKEGVQAKGRIEAEQAKAVGKRDTRVNAYLHIRQEARLRVLYFLAEVLELDVYVLLISNKEVL